MAEKEEHSTSLVREHTDFFQKENGDKDKLFSVALSPEKRQEAGRLTGNRQISINSVLSPDPDETRSHITVFDNPEAQGHMQVWGLIIEE